MKIFKKPLIFILDTICRLLSTVFRFLGHDFGFVVVRNSRKCLHIHYTAGGATGQVEQEEMETWKIRDTQSDADATPT